jgi:hypothetical protein
MKTNRIQIDAPRDGFPLRINSPERKNAVRRMLFFLLLMALHWVKVSLFNMRSAWIPEKKSAPTF